MTIGSTAPRVSFACNGVSTVFPVPIQAYLATDFEVIHTTAAGVSSILVLNSDYSLTVSGTLQPPAWTLTTLAATPFPAGDFLQTFINPTQTQQTNYAQGQAFPSLAVVTNFDRLTQMVQRLQDQLNRTVIAPDGDLAPGLMLPPASTRALLYLAFDGNGNVLPTAALPGTANTIASLGPILNPRTAAEIASGVTPVNYAYATLDVRRYGADPTGVSDSTAAFNTLLTVMLQLGGASAIVWPGAYKISGTVTGNLAPSAGPTAVTYGLRLYAEGVVFNYTGSGYAFDLFATNTSAVFAFPILTIYGANLLGTAAALGGWRTRSLSAVHWHQVKTQGFTNGPAWTMLNDSSWSENNHFRSCAAVNCQSVIAFQLSVALAFTAALVAGATSGTLTSNWTQTTAAYTVIFSDGETRTVTLTNGANTATWSGPLANNVLATTTGGTNSFARTYVDGLFAAGITAFWFDLGGGVSVYDSRFTHLSGNFTGLACFAIGSASGPIGADMTGSVVDGIDYEVNATQAGQGVFRLRDFPQVGGSTRRPLVYNLNAFATNSGSIPVWTNNAGAAVTLEPIATQPLIALTGLLTYEANYGLTALLPVPSFDSVLQAGISVTGFASPPAGRVIFSRTGNIAQMKVFDPLTGTSNANTLTLTTIPAEYRPATASFQACMLFDNNTSVPGQAAIGTNGVITFAIATAFNAYSNTGFTASGPKGLGTGWTLTWPLT